MSRRLIIAVLLLAAGCTDQIPREVAGYELRGAPVGSTSDGGRIKKIGTADYEVTAFPDDTAALLRERGSGACAGQEICAVRGIAAGGKLVMSYRKQPPVGQSASFDCKALPDGKPDCL